jgi:molecular chaperone Hsp33
MIGQGVTPEFILKQLLGEKNMTILEKIPVQFRCECSRDRISNAIISLGSEEIRDMIDTDGHFCNENYYYSKEDLETLLKVGIS